VKLFGQFLVAGALLGGLAACTKPYSFKTETPEVVAINELPANFKIPSRVWELIEGEEPTHKSGEPAAQKSTEGGNKAEGEKAEGSVEKAKSPTPPILYSSLKVFMAEKNPGILKSPSYRIDLPRGGGSFDLSNYVSENSGSFFVGFELPEEFIDGTNFKALYISQARKRKVEDRILGGGCSQFFDITRKFLEMMKTEGIRANTTRQRHVTLLAGHYIFSVLKEGRIYITQATITDSKNKNLLCEAL
jgi:hypothetical protein